MERIKNALILLKKQRKINHFYQKGGEWFVRITRPKGYKKELINHSFKTRNCVFSKYCSDEASVMEAIRFELVHNHNLLLAHIKDIRTEVFFNHEKDKLQIDSRKTPA